MLPGVCFEMLFCSDRGIMFLLACVGLETKALFAHFVMKQITLMSMDGLVIFVY